MKRKRRKFPKLPPEEWDFSTLDEPMMARAFIWEHARSSALVRRMESEIVEKGSIKLRNAPYGRSRYGKDYEVWTMPHVEWLFSKMHLFSKPWIKIPKPDHCLIAVFDQTQATPALFTKHAWAKLRNLAALRLFESGFSFAQAQEEIREHIRNHGTDPAKAVLPNYSPAGWVNAIRKAKAEVREIEAAVLDFCWDLYRKQQAKKIRFR